MSLWDFCIRRPVFTTVLMASMALLGMLGYSRMGVDLFPDFDIPIVTVQTILPGANPEVMDQDVTDVIETEVGSLEGVESIRSQSFEGYSSIVVEFDLKRDVDVCAQEVRDKVSAVMRDLPTGIDPPLIQKVDPGAQSILFLALYGDLPYQELSDFADNVLKERLQTLDGVGSVALQGFRKRTIRIWLDPVGMQKYDLGPAQVVDAVQRWHVELPGGRIESEIAESSIKLEGEFLDLEGLRSLAVDWRGGAAVRLQDVARLEDGEEDLRSIARFNGKPAILVGIKKQSGANTVSVAEAVKEQVPEFRKLLPPGAKLDPLFDNSHFIVESVNGVQFDLIFGAAFTAVVIFVFLRHLTLTFISVVAIPTSLLGALGLMYFLDFSINQLTMLGMSLAVGLVIDDAIVVLENIHRHVEEGSEPAEAASGGTAEVAFAVLAATVAIAAIFLPVAFMGGIIGRIFYEFGMTVALAILLSLVVSLTLTPMLSARWLHAGSHENALSRLVLKFLNGLDRGYRRALEACLRTRPRRVLVLLAAFAAFLVGLGLATQVGKEFISEVDRSQFQVFLETPIGTSLTTTDERVRQAEKLLVAHPEVSSYGATVGESTGEVHKARLVVEMVPRHDRELSQQQVMELVREELNAIPGLVAYPSQIASIAAGGTRESDINYVVQGPDLRTLEVISNRIVQAAKADPTFLDVDDDLQLVRPQVTVTPRREAAADVRLDTRQIALALQAMMGGLDIARFKVGGQRYDIRVKADESFRRDAESVRNIVLRTPSGARVEMGSVVDVEEGVGPNSVNRYNRSRSVTLLANVRQGIAKGDGTDRFLALADEVLRDHPDYTIVAGGNTKVMQESFGHLMFALASSIVIIYLVLAAQFESFIHPFTIMMSLPLAIAGVFAALLLTGKTFSIFAIIGLIMLVGIVTRNGILLVDFANQQRAKEATAQEAMLQAGPVRLRPILMTALAAMVGVLPVALGLSEGGESRAGMGVAVIGGLLTSTVLTLFVIPTVYVTFDELSRLRRTGR